MTDLPQPTTARPAPGALTFSAPRRGKAPQHLADLDLAGRKAWAKELGILMVINPDAHSTAELALYRYGVDVARRGWLTAKDVANTRTAGQVEKLLRKAPSKSAKS